MEYRRLGNSGLKVSAMTLGNWATHGAQIDDRQAIATVHAALDIGITTFDTADAYAEGRAEVLLGQALAGQNRANLEILTKVFWPMGAGPNNQGLSRKHILSAVDASLRRLDVDYIDVYQAHRFDADQITPSCADLGIGQIVWSPLAQGMLTGKYLPGQPPPPHSRATDPDGAAYISRWMRDEVLTAVQGLAPIAETLGLTTAQLSLAWVLSQPTICSAIVGASNPDQLRANALAVDASLKPDTLTDIENVMAGVAILERPELPL